MGGGHLTRPDFGMPQADPAHPLTEFYLLLQRTLEHEHTFALPALYAELRLPARRIYAEEAREALRLSAAPQEGFVKLLEPRRLLLLYTMLHVAPGGAPAALLLTEECTRTTCAVQLLPPFLWEEPLPPVPDCAEALSLQLRIEDVEAIDTQPAVLGQRMAQSVTGKCWLRHPKAETFLAERVALMQRVYR